MQNYLTEKLLLNSQHGADCVLEICKPGFPDDDELIFRGDAGDSLRFLMEYELPMDGGSYFSFTTNQDNYCGYNFAEIAHRMGFTPEKLEKIIGVSPSVDAVIGSAACRAGEKKETFSPKVMDI